MDIQSKIDNFPEEVKSKYFKISQELEQTIKQANKEIQDTYEQCKNNKNFNKFDSLTKRKWYYERLEERIRQRIYVKYRIDLFGSLSRVVDTILPSVIEENMNRFVDIRNVELGDKV